MIGFRIFQWQKSVTFPLIVDTYGPIQACLISKRQSHWRGLLFAIQLHL